jgi:hypothetical protein
MILAECASPENSPRARRFTSELIGDGKGSDSGGSSQPASAGGRWSTSPENQAKARKFFEHAKKSAETRNYDYAVQLYCDGLAFWPDAVEEGLKPLRWRPPDGWRAARVRASWPRRNDRQGCLQALSNAMHLYGLDRRTSRTWRRF